MAEQLIVGAGLSGLVAAINLARRGHAVRVLEKYRTVGAQPERWPAVDVTPMDPGKLGAYIGIPLGQPQVKRCASLTGYFWGREFDVPIARSGLCCVERGPRSTGLEGYLLEMALAEGVRVEFERPVLGQGEIAALPRGTIIATGLYAESFDALGIPYRMGYCYGGKGRSDRDAEALIYFGDYTDDYAYWASLNGVDMMFFFTRRPIRKERFAQFEREIEATQGLRYSEWLAGYGPTPTVRLSNPRLFAAGKILAGTVSGMMEPFVLFGVHGALVSGKIAAMAVEDPGAAWLEFRRCLAGWRTSLLNRRVYDRMPAPMRRAAVTGLNDVLSASGRLGELALSGAFRAVPGYRRVTEAASFPLP